MKDGRTHLAHKAENAVDLGTGAIVGVTVQGADQGDTTTIAETVTTAAEELEAVAAVIDGDTAVIEEVVADKGTQQSGARRPGALDLRTYIAEPVRGRRNWTQQAAVYVLSMLFASLAVVVACTGLYGLVAYSVVRRTREIGIRLAVGAQRGQVMRLFIKDAAVLVGTGVALGIPASLAAGRQFSTMLYGLDPSNVWMLLVASSILATVAAVAAGLPAARATTVDPATVLREQ